ncbi:MAG TPA: hypothetical protein PKW69_01075, partial [Niabella sp.]|nr:hypothetical protein [Niabella sp.]
MKIDYNKNRFMLLSLFAAALFAGSCTKQLEQNTKTVITDPVFWKNTNDLMGGVNYLYQSVPDFGTPLDDLNSDFAANVFGGTFNTISDGSRNVPSGDG